MRLASVWRKLIAVPAWLAIGLVQLYRLLVSPLLGSNCRHQPTCSRYAVEALKTHGLPTGLTLTAMRISRCHPLHPGGYDPVP